MSLTETGHRLLADARAMLALADEADGRLHEDQTVLRGHLRLFATIDSGQSIFTRLITSFIQANPGITAELGYTNRPSRMIEEAVTQALWRATSQTTASSPASRHDSALSGSVTGLG